MKKISREELLEVLSYDPKTGIFLWEKRLSNRIKIGDKAGHRLPSGYFQIRIRGNMHLAHRLAWLHEFGRFPNGVIDHINGKPWDNRISNLRECSQAENCRNSLARSDSSHGVKGVSFHKASGLWTARITVGGKTTSLKCHKTIEDAASAYELASREIHGEFALVNRPSHS